MVRPPELPGVVGPAGPEPTLEWVDRGPGVVGAMAARVGSEFEPEALVRIVVAALRGAVAEDTWEGVVDDLPYPVRTALRARPAPARPASSWNELVRAVATEAQQPSERAAWYARAVLASLRSALPRGLADALAGELPADVAAAWQAAR